MFISHTYSQPLSLSHMYLQPRPRPTSTNLRRPKENLYQIPSTTQHVDLNRHLAYGIRVPELNCLPKSLSLTLRMVIHNP